MTIAACYLSSEGVVFGADSTSTIFVASRGPDPSGAEHHFNYAQKIFEIGEDSTLGITMWGLGNLESLSYRTLIAQFAESLLHQPAPSMTDAANRWNDFFWSSYCTEMAPILQRTQQLLGQANRTPQEQLELDFMLQTFSGGFCLGGCLRHEHLPQAFEMVYRPDRASPGPVQPLLLGSPRFWGVPNLIERLLYGIDSGVADAILSCGRWQGTLDDLFAVVQPFFLGQPQHLPIREAIDWIHSSIHTTIKAMKFSHLPPVCGGSVEIAVITTDRPFRWVRYKRLDSAIVQGGFDGA